MSLLAAPTNLPTPTPGTRFREDGPTPLSATLQDLATPAQATRFRLVALTRVKFDGDIIEEFVRHTLRFVDHLYVVDNVSPDSTREILDALVAEGLPLTVWEDDIHEGRDGIMTDLAHRVLGRDRADYCVILDADEFLRVESRGAFEAALARLPAGAHATIPWVTYIPTPNDPDVAQMLGRIRYRQCAEALSFSKVVLARAFADHPSAEVTVGAHSVEYPDAVCSVLPLEGVELAHFPVRSIEQLQGKALLGWSAFLLTGRAGDTMLGYQWRRLYEALQKNHYWGATDLYHFALTYLDADQSGPELALDPMPAVHRKYVRAVPDVLTISIAYTRLLADYCVKLKSERAQLESELAVERRVGAFTLPIEGSYAFEELTAAYAS